ncbi:MAG: hypothetical protein WCH11_04365 [Bdellovibrio sp.]
MSNRYAIVNAEGEVVRSVQLSDSWLEEGEKSELILVLAGPAKRLEILAGDEEFAELQAKMSKLRWKFQEVARIFKEVIHQEKELGAGLKWLALRDHLPLFADQTLQKASGKGFGFALGVVSVSVLGFLVTILNLNIGMQKLEQELKQQVVQIVKKIPPKKTSVQATMNSQAVQPKTPQKASLQRMGALSVLGSLSKSQQRGGLNLGAVQTTAGPGLGGNAGSGGVKTNIYARGAVAAPLGSGGNLQGGGGYGTKGKGGGQAGYGNLSIVGSRGTSSIPLTSEASVGGGWTKISSAL